MHTPSSNTPTPAALVGAINHAIDWNSAHSARATAVVLVTDGGTNACGTDMDVVNAAAAGLTNGIPTYVIGVISPNTTCNLDPNPPNAQTLNDIAAAGGTRTAALFDVTKDSAKTFAGLIAAIETDARIPCHHALPASASPIDPNQVNLEYVPAGSSARIRVPQVSNSGSCDAALGGWFYDNAAAPKEVILCPKSCTGLGKSPLTIELGCASVRGP